MGKETKVAGREERVTDTFTEVPKRIKGDGLMFEMFRYSDDEIKDILKSIVILWDSNEKKNEHILQQFDKRGIAYKKQRLNFGDYSFYLPQNEALGVPRDIWFDNKLTIERKASLEELSGNFTKGRANFEEELTRKKNSMMYLMIEDGTYKDLITGNYRTNYDKKSYIATLNTYEIRFGIKTAFIPKELAASFIYFKCY